MREAHATFRWSLLELCAARHPWSVDTCERVARAKAYREGISQVTETFSRVLPEGVEVVVVGEAGGTFDHTDMD